MKKLAILMAALMLMTLTAGMASAAGKTTAKAPATAAAPAKIEMMSGEVVNIDAAAGTIVIKSHDKDRTLKAEPKLLEGFYAGERVNIEVTGDMLKSIKKVEAPAIK
jgi:ABC-type Fe3+-hydroxamate transport system substrate-binding protein